MKLTVLLIAILFLSPIHAETIDSVSGNYETIPPLSCNLVIELTQNNQVGQYKVSTNSTSESGNFQLVDQYIVFSQLFAAEPSGDEPLEVSALIEGNTLLIQNYGNSMNPYTLFPECEAKYISLEKIQL